MKMKLTVAIVATAIGLSLPTTAQTPTTPTADELLKAQIDAEVARLEALKKLADARNQLAVSEKAAAQAEAQARTGAITGLSGGADGSISLKSDAGKGEATLLAAKAVESAAKSIATNVKTHVANKRIVLASGLGGVQLANYQQFVMRKEAARVSAAASMDEASRIFAEADDLAERARDTSRVTTKVAPLATPALTTVGVTLDALTKLGTYFQSSTEFGTVDVTGVGNDQFVAAVAGELAGSATVLLPATSVLPNSELVKEFEAINDQVAPIQSVLATHVQKEAAARRDAEQTTDSNRKLMFGKAADLYKDGVAKLQAAVNGYKELATSLATDAGGKPLGVKVVQEKAIYDAFFPSPTSETLLLSLDVSGASGGYYTKRNAWSFLGTTPFYAMGGAVAAYSLSEPSTGRVVQSGLVPVHSGYRKVVDVAKTINK